MIILKTFETKNTAVLTDTLVLRSLSDDHYIYVSVPWIFLVVNIDLCTVDIV